MSSGENWRNADRDEGKSSCQGQIAPTGLNMVDLVHVLVEMEQKLERTIQSRLDILQHQLNSKLFYIETKVEALTELIRTGEEPLSMHTGCHGRGNRTNRSQQQNRHGGSSRYGSQASNLHMLGRYAMDGGTIDEQQMEEAFSNSLVDDNSALSRLFHASQQQMDQQQQHQQPQPSTGYKQRKFSAAAPAACSAGGHRGSFDGSPSLGFPGYLSGANLQQKVTRGGNGKQQAIPGLDGGFGSAAPRGPRRVNNRWAQMLVSQVMANQRSHNGSENQNQQQQQQQQQNVHPQLEGGPQSVDSRQTRGTASTDSNKKHPEWTPRSLNGSYTESENSSDEDSKDEEEEEDEKSKEVQVAAKRGKAAELKLKGSKEVGLETHGSDGTADKKEKKEQQKMAANGRRRSI